MVFTLLIAAFSLILLLIVLFTLFGAIGRRMVRSREAPDPVIADSRDEFDLK